MGLALVDLLGPAQSVGHVAYCLPAELGRRPGARRGDLREGVRDHVRLLLEPRAAHAGALRVQGGRRNQGWVGGSKLDCAPAIHFTHTYLSSTVHAPAIGSPSPPPHAANSPPRPHPPSAPIKKQDIA